MKILGLDPGKRRDSFGIVGIEVIENKIFVKLCKRFLGHKYGEVADEITKLNLRYSFDHIVLEMNNTGEAVSEMLDERGVRYIPTVTSREIKDPKKKVSMKVMDKNEIARLIKKYKDVTHQLKFPPEEKLTPELRELERQISIFAEKRTDAGSFSYSAPGEEHDDLVMALMLSVFIGRYYLNSEPKGMGVASSTKSPYTQEDDEWGSGLSGFQKLKSRQVYWS